VVTSGSGPTTNGTTSGTASETTSGTTSGTTSETTSGTTSGDPLVTTNATHISIASHSVWGTFLMCQRIDERESGSTARFRNKRIVAVRRI